MTGRGERREIGDDLGEPVMAEFHARFPEVAEKETRMVIIMHDGDLGLPRGEYLFIESYCVRKIKDCDCRRVFLNVWNGKEFLATIGYGWEDKGYYANWFGTLATDQDLVSDMKGPILELTGYNSKYSTQLLDLFKKVLMKDSIYMERLKRHYKLFKSKR